MGYVEPPPYTVIRDTREKNGWHFSNFDGCLGMVQQALKTGDYSIEGLEDKVCIERKGCIEEMALNLGQNKPQFMAEIERMKPFAHKFIILEFTIDELLSFPKDSRIPLAKQKNIKLTGKYILKCLMEFQVYEDIHVMFCGNKQHAFIFVSSLLKRLNEMYTIGRKK